MTVKSEIERLGSQCFSIENQLKMFNAMELGTNSNEQILRQELYRIRIQINALVRYAEMVDESRKLTKKKCPNKDQNGVCQMHNLQCGYPNCEQ